MNDESSLGVRPSEAGDVCCEEEYAGVLHAYCSIVSVPENVAVITVQ